MDDKAKQHKYSHRGFIVDWHYPINGTEAGQLLRDGEAKLIRDNRTGRVRLKVCDGKEHKVRAGLAKGVKEDMWADDPWLKMCRRQNTQGQLKGKLKQRNKAPYKISEAQYSAVTRLKYGSDYMHYYKWIEAQRLLAGEGAKSDLDIVVQVCIDKGDKALARELRQSNKG